MQKKGCRTNVRQLLSLILNFVSVELVKGSGGSDVSRLADQRPLVFRRENGEYLVKLQAFRQIEGSDGETFAERGAVPVKKGEGIFYIETSGGEFFTENLVSLLGLRGGA